MANGQMTFAAADVTQNVRLFMDHIRDQSVSLSSSESALTRVNKGRCSLCVTKGSS